MLVVALVVSAVLVTLRVTQQPVSAAGLVAFAVQTSRDSNASGGPEAGDAIDEFKYMINVDNTGDPYDDPTDCEADADENFPANFPEDCAWPSMRSFEAGSPVFTQGDESDFAAGGDFDGGVLLPTGKYLISVIADGHKIGGAHFSVDDSGGVSVDGDAVADSVVPVLLDPYPLPLATLRIRVFEDLTTNGQVDLPAESGVDMSGFTATINDWADEVTDDWYGNPICTEYETHPVTGQIVLDADGQPTPVEPDAADGVAGGKCVSDVNGDIVIPNLGPNRYAATVAPPPGTDWVQTTTLEGGLDWDVWAMEGYTGFDTEFNVGGEAVPWVTFGFVHPRSRTGAPTTPSYFTNPTALGSNSIKGTVAAYDAYTPGAGQVPVPGTIWGGFSGGVITGPVERPYIALVDLQDGDRSVFVGRGAADGSFQINGVRDGEYQVTIWDDELAYLLDFFQVTVQDGQVLDLGVLGLTGWFGRYDGHIFLDYNENGRRDPGEPGVPDFGLTLRNRENNAVENGQAAATTDQNGHYEFDVVYPYTMWTIMEAYHPRFTTTGVTYQASNQPTETTVLGAGVDINVLPIIGQSMRVDWGVRPYREDENGSIAGTVFYDTTRNELDPRLAAVEDWAPGVPNIPITVYEAVPDGDGWTKGDPVESTETERWERPGACVPRDADGAVETEQLVFPPGAGSCIEAPLTGIQVDPMVNEDGFGASVNGNFGFGELAPGKYIVEVDIPTDVFGRPLYKVEDENSVNVFAGDVYTPQNAIGLPSAGGDFGDNQPAGAALPSEDPTTQAPGATGICVGELVDVDVNLDSNPAFADAGGTPYQGLSRPGCEAKLIEVLDGRGVAPSFTLYTEVPPPAHYWGYSIDDLNVGTNPRRSMFGYLSPMSHAPHGVYDWSGRLITHVNADPNGIWEVLMPSTTTMNCPTPSGVCPNMYRFVGNDPGSPGNRFRDYNPNYRTIAANFQAWPGLNTVADTAPTQVGASIRAAGGMFDALSVCTADDADVPQLFRVNRPYVRVRGGSNTNGTLRNLEILGDHFGTPAGQVRLLKDGAVVAVLPITLWTDDRITLTVPNTTTRAAYQLDIVTAAGLRPVNTITLHVIYFNNTSQTGTYNPVLVEVGPGAQPFHTVQAGLDSVPNPGNRGAIVVVYPNTVTPTNLDGAYYENLVVAAPVTVQGVGPGGTYANGTDVQGTMLHGGNFWAAGVDPNDPTAELEPNAQDWYTRLSTMQWSGNQNIADGAVVYVIAGLGDQTFRSNRIGRLDGLMVTGGDQRGFPGNINIIGGGQGGGEPGDIGDAGNIQTQGGGVFVNGFAPYFRITNNVFQSNGGAYGGAIRLGTPFAGDNANDNIVISHNRIVSNGSTNLAGAVAVFNGADNYEISDNKICGNSSLEYGGGISHFGFSPGGRIVRNSVMLNSAYDEGGGVTIAGELPADPSQASVGAGPVIVRSNVISSNLSNDDGGGLRFLQAGNFEFDVYNNVIANNVATHQGGGVAIDDAPDVNVFNNTVAGNITTATALTSDGLPAPAGLSTTPNSHQLQSTLDPGAPTFSDPLLFNNIFSDNRAGTWAGTAGVLGIGNNGAADVNLWDIGAIGAAGSPSPTYSMLENDGGVNSDPTNVMAGVPDFVDPRLTHVGVFTWRSYQRFRSSAIISLDASNPLGDYHIGGGSDAIDAGAASAAGVPAPLADIDGGGRPTGAAWDIGADERPGTVLSGSVTAVLDSFTRGTNSNTNINAGLMPPWWGGNVALSRVRIQTYASPTYASSRVLQLRGVGNQIWLPDAGFGDAQEAYVTFAMTPSFMSSVGVVLRATGTNNNGNLGSASSYVEVAYAPYQGGIVVRTKNAGQGNPVARMAFTTGFEVGDTLLARIDADGHLAVYRRPGIGAWVLLGVVDLGGVGPNAWPAVGAPPGGRIGLRSTMNVQPARADNFGGGDVN